MAEYLLEIRTQDMPSRLVQDAIRQLGGRLFEDLMGRGLAPREMLTGATMRRLSVFLRGLPEEEPAREERELGPPKSEAYDDEGEPTDALIGFAQRLALPLEALETIKTEKGEYLAALRKRPGRSTGVVLQELLSSILSGIRWGKASIPGVGRGEKAVPRNVGLRWGEEGTDRAGTWIRPLAGLLSLYNGEVLELEFGGCQAERISVGHPILSPEPFEVNGLEHYLQEIEARGIVLDFEARLAALKKQCDRLAEERGAQWQADRVILERMAWSCEIPGVVACVLEPEYLALPREVIEATLRLQLAVPLYEGEELMPVFLTVMDRAEDESGKVALGQQRVMSGRLTDGRFFWEADRRRPLAERRNELDFLPFHEQLGSYGEKVARLSGWTEVLCEELDATDEIEAAREAVFLLKTDLTTEMAQGYPSLRGVIGGIYAREEGSIESVWQAVYDQYQPRTHQDAIPRGRLGRIVAVADRLDTLVGILGLGEIPTGRKDPWQLRLVAQGLLRIVIEAGFDLDLDLIAARSVLSYGDLLPRAASEILVDLRSFLDDRTRNLLGRVGFAHDEIATAMAVPSQSLPDLVARVTALKNGRSELDFHSLVQASKRLFNIVKDWPEFELRVELLVEEAEMDLYTIYVEVRDQVLAAARERRYETCLEAMEHLVEPLDRFFNEVLVIAEDETLRDNRIALLQSIRRVFWRIGKFKEMVVDRAEPTP